MNWKIEYYSEDVRLWVEKLPISIRACYLRITERMLQYGPNLGLPFTRAMKNGLFEVRAHGKEGIARVLYCTVKNQKIIMLHGFIKKTEQTPNKELNIAIKRLKEIKSEKS